MPSTQTTDSQWSELALRLGSRNAHLQEVSARYLQTSAAAQAARQRISDPKGASLEWRKAAQEYPKAVALYRQASDALAALERCGLGPRYGPGVGEHVLSLCNEWLSADEDRRRLIDHAMEGIQAALGRMAVESVVRRPGALSAEAIEALRASGWEPPVEPAPPAGVQEGGAASRRRAGGFAMPPRPRDGMGAPPIRPIPPRARASASPKAAPAKKGGTGRARAKRGEP